MTFGAFGVQSPFQPADRAFLSDVERRVLDALRRTPMASRADVGRIGGLAKATVSGVVDGLIKRGFIEEGDRVSRGRGQPIVELRLVPSAAYCFGVSLMTDAFAVSLLDLSGAPLASRVEAVPDLTRERLFARLRAQIEQLTKKHIADPSRIFGIGLGVTGHFVGDGAKVNPPSPLDDFALIDLQSLFEAEFAMPVLVENDGAVAAIGELLNGHGAATANFAYLFFSAGFGGGVIIDGQMQRGAHGNAGEFAGVLPPGEYLQPSLETLRAAVAQDGPRFESLGAFLTAFDPAWPGVSAWLEQAARSLSLVCSAIHSTIDCEAIVFGGRIPRALAEALIARIKIYSVPRRGMIRPQPRLLGAAAQGDATSIGAAALLLKTYFF